MANKSTEITLRMTDQWILRDCVQKEIERVQARISRGFAGMSADYYLKQNTALLARLKVILSNIEKD